MLVANARAARRALPVPLALENIAALLEWPGAEMDEAIFLAEALERADALLLLDVANVYANARNHGWDPLEYLDRLPLERLAYVHVAGGVEHGGLYHDSHAHPVPAEVLGLLEELSARVAVPGVLLERDDRFPPDAEIVAELDVIAAAVERGAARREAARCFSCLRLASGWRPSRRPSCGPWPTGPRPPRGSTRPASAPRPTPWPGSAPGAWLAPGLLWPARWATVSGRSSSPMRPRPARPATVGPSPTAAPSPARSPTGENCRRPPTSR